MKNILITGENGYIGNALANRLIKNSEIRVMRLSLKSDEWKKYDFSHTDVIIHNAALVHNKEAGYEQFKKVNEDLTVELAQIAKQNKVKQFIFMSTMGVYSQSAKEISKFTQEKPSNNYAKSKYNAEKKLEQFQDKDFNISIVRPPIVYGYKAPGNYESLSRLFNKIPFFVDVENKRSMIYIDNLIEFLYLLALKGGQGIYFPQNKEFINVASIYQIISEKQKKPYSLINLKLFPKKLLEYNNILNKVLGDYYYLPTLPGGPESNFINEYGEYNIVNFNDSILRSEKIK
ncbi:SDR family oxidoreductase [Macrococcus epidermidis]|uniref:NAD-dependent epimerase/dehydratase family protein n=1 Tax=Macrococcus epidermidis TaxID=1902580 RepID=UPI001EF2DB82|nr:NAD-dependent epimerase/dehydratase family protein [Macrococcus epidermidis]MCG7421122.1 SDR family oxidoreductase [Macrococcus epidermidis]